MIEAQARAVWPICRSTRGFPGSQTSGGTWAYRARSVSRCLITLFTSLPPPADQSQDPEKANAAGLCSLIEPRPCGLCGEFSPTDDRRQQTCFGYPLGQQRLEEHLNVDISASNSYRCPPLRHQIAPPTAEGVLNPLRRRRWTLGSRSGYTIPTRFDRECATGSTKAEA